MPAPERRRLFEKRARRHGPRGVVGIVDPEELCAAEDVLRDGGKIREKTPLGPEAQPVDLALREARPAAVGRVTGIRHEDDIARVDEGFGEVEDRLLRADRGADLLTRVEAHLKTLVRPAGDRLAVVARAHVARIAAGRVGVDALLEGIADDRRRRLRGIAHAEVDHRHPGGAERCDLRIDLGEGVARQFGEAFGNVKSHGSLVANVEIRNPNVETIPKSS